MEIKYQEEMKSEHNWRHRPCASAINFFKLGHREGTRRARGGQEVIVVNWWRIAFLLQLQTCPPLAAEGGGRRDATVERLGYVCLTLRNGEAARETGILRSELRSSSVLTSSRVDVSRGLAVGQAGWEKSSFPVTPLDSTSRRCW